MIIVTGAAGFIGSALIAALNKRAITDILVVDELRCDQRWKNLANLSFADYVEKDDFRPLNIYGYSKQLFDLWARRTGLLKKIVGLKYFNIFGPNEYHKQDMRSFVIKAFEQINAAGKVRLFKSYMSEYNHGQQMRDFLYVKDAVDMTLFFFDNPNTAGIFNIGTGKARTWNDLAKAVFTAMAKKPNIEYIDMPDSIRNQYQYFTQADITKLTQTGYKKQLTPLETTIKDYVQNYLQKNGYLTSI